MRKDLLIIALGLALATGPAKADVLATPEENPAATSLAPASLPAKGVTMSAVEKKFGAPREKHAPRGGGSPKHPPITRWDYESFAVFFEHDKVVDAVIPGRPPRVYNKDQLTPVAASAAPPPPVAPTADIPPPPAEMSPPVMEEEELLVPPPAESMAPTEPPAEAAAALAPGESSGPAASEPAATEPATTETATSEPPPATPSSSSSYPDRPPSQTPAEEIPDQPPTPR